MQSRTHYSLQDLYFDEINLAEINEVRHECIKYAMLPKKSLDSSLEEKIESFIESAREFRDKKDLIFAVNGSKLKYQGPTITQDGLRVREATKESLINLDYCLTYLDMAICFPDDLFLNQNSAHISGTVLNDFIEKISSADREAINVISDRKFVEFRNLSPPFFLNLLIWREILNSHAKRRPRWWLQLLPLQSC